jgi:hypothetical protein
MGQKLDGLRDQAGSENTRDSNPGMKQ